MVSESFQRQLYAAFEKQLHEHEQSVARFADTIATLCESEVCDGRTIATALRDLSGGSPTVPAIPPSLELHSSGSRTLMTQVSSLPSLSETRNETEALMGLHSLGGLMSPRSVMKVEKGAYSMSPRGAKVMKKMGNKPKDGARRQTTSGAPNTLTGCETEDVAHMQTAFRVEKLRFLSAEGKIIKPPSHWLESLGPVRPVVQGCVNAISSGIAGLGEPDGHSVTMRLIESRAFKICSILAITLNYLFIMFTTDWKMSHLSDDDPVSFRVIDLSFTSYYALELAISIIALRGQFFFGFDCGWNWFDLVIVFFSIFQEVLMLWEIKSIDTSFLRVLRFMRISKILRMFEAMRMFKEVKIMVDSIQGSFVVFAMCVLMLCLYLSIFAIFFVQGITTKLAHELTLDTPELAEPTKTLMLKHFGTCSEAMITLFQALTGGRDWDDYYAIIQDMGTVYAFLFLFFFLFALMSIFNVVTGVFCEKAMSLARPGPREQMIRRMQKDMFDATELIGLLKKVLNLKEPYPPISHDKFETFLKHEEAITYFETRGMHITSAQRFFEVLADIRESNEIDFSTFVSACIKLDGPASSIDLHILDIEMKAIQIGLYHTHFQIAEQLEKLGTRLLQTIRESSGGQQRLQEYRPSTPSLNNAEHLRHLSKGFSSDAFHEPQMPVFDSQHVVINHDFSNVELPTQGSRRSSSQGAPLLHGGGHQFSPAFPEATAGRDVFTFHYV